MQYESYAMVDPHSGTGFCAICYMSFYFVCLISQAIENLSVWLIDYGLVSSGWEHFLKISLDRHYINEHLQLQL